MLVGSLLFSLLLVAETFFHFAIINAKELIRAGRHVHEIRFIQFIQALLEANGLAAGKDHQFKGRYDAEKNAVIISLEKDEQSALSPQKCTT